MKTRFILFRRAGIYYCEDTATGKQSSLRTRDEAEALAVLNAKNESVRQPVLNLQIARAYLSASDPAFLQRTWQNVMEQMSELKSENTLRRPACRSIPAAKFSHSAELKWKGGRTVTTLFGMLQRLVQAERAAIVVFKLAKNQG